MNYRYFTLFLLSLLFLSCGGEQVDYESPAGNPADMAAGMAAVQQKNDRPVHDKETVKAMLPERLLGMERENINSNAMGAGGFNLATATATYRKANSNRRITVTISDGMGGNMASMGMVNSLTMDSEEGSKSTKTIQIDGHKAIRSFDSSTMLGSLSVIFDQSVVQIEGRHLGDVNELEAAYDELELDEL